MDIKLCLSMLYGYPFGYPWISMDIRVLTCCRVSIQGKTCSSTVFLWRDGTFKTEKDMLRNSSGVFDSLKRARLWATLNLECDLAGHVSEWVRTSRDKRRAAEDIIWPLPFPVPPQRVACRHQGGRGGRTSLRRHCTHFRNRVQCTRCEPRRQRTPVRGMGTHAGRRRGR